MRTLFLATLLFSAASAQSAPKLQLATPAQQKAINKIAQSFTGRTCHTYSVARYPTPAGITPAQESQVLDRLFRGRPELYKAVRLPLTRTGRTPNGGRLMYIATGNLFLQAAPVGRSDKRYNVIFLCQLK